MKVSESHTKTCPVMTRPDPNFEDGFRFAFCQGPDCAMWESWERTLTSGKVECAGEGDCGLKGKVSEVYHS